MGFSGDSVDMAEAGDRPEAGGADRGARCAARALRVHVPGTQACLDYLVEETTRLVAAGITPQEVLLVENSRPGRSELRTRLQQAGGGAEDVRVVGALDFMTGVLDSNDARKATGRKPRLLTRCEQDLLLADLQVAGADLRVTGKLLRRMALGLACELPEGDWGMREAEEEALASLRGMLVDEGAMLCEELPALCSSYLQKCSRLGLDGPCVRHVLVDWGQGMDRASAHCLALLASERLAVVCIDGLPIAQDKAHFPLSGLENLVSCGRVDDVAWGHDVTAAPVAAAVRQLVRSSDATETGGVGEAAQAGLQSTITLVKWREPADEFRGVARIVQRLLAADKELEPQDICIAAPNEYWVRSIREELDHLRVPSQKPAGHDLLGAKALEKGSISRGVAALYAALALCADRDDLAAMRLLLASGRVADRGIIAWRNLIMYSKNNMMDIASTIDLLKSTVKEDKEIPFDGADAVGRCALEADKLVADAAGKRGFNLLYAVGGIAKPEAVKEVSRLIDGDEDIPAMLTLLRSLSLSPDYLERPPLVRVGTYSSMRCLSPRILFATGLADGLMPAVPDGADERERHARVRAQRRALAWALAGTRGALYIGLTQHMDLAEAIRLHIPFARARSLHGRQIAVFARSPFLDDMGEAMPGSVSGEQFFATWTGGLQ